MRVWLAWLSCPIRRAATVAVLVHVQYLMGLERIVTRHHLPLPSMRSGCSSGHGAAVYIKKYTLNTWFNQRINVIDIQQSNVDNAHVYNALSVYIPAKPYNNKLHPMPSHHKFAFLPNRSLHIPLQEGKWDKYMCAVHTQSILHPSRLSPLIMHQRRLNETISFSWERYLPTFDPGPLISPL